MGDILDYKEETVKVITAVLFVKDTIVDTLHALFDDLRENKDVKGARKEMKGHEFKRECDLVISSKKENSGIIDVSIQAEELALMKKYCKEYGVDLLVQDRPNNLEALFERQQAGEILNDYQANIVAAFTIKNDEGKPMLQDGGYLLSFKDNDISAMNKIVQKIDDKVYSIEARKNRAISIYKKHKNDKKTPEVREQKKNTPEKKSVAKDF